MTPGSLFVIATPIGNLEDITYRAVSTLKNVDYIVCEDTRVSRKLLNKYDINSNLISCNEHNELKKINSIKKILLDGNDVVSVQKKSKVLINNIRKNKGPAIIEAITYRWYGHVDWRDDIDVGVERSLKDIENWKLRDPINRLSKSMIYNKIWTKIEESNFINKIDREIETAWKKASSDSYPSSKSVLNYVY